MLLFRLLAWPTLLFSSRTWDLQAWNAVVQLIPTGWGRKLPEIWGNETYQPAIASCDATEYEYLSVCPIDKLVKHPYLHFTCQVANIHLKHRNLSFKPSLWELDLFQWLRESAFTSSPTPTFRALQVSCGTPTCINALVIISTASRDCSRQRLRLRTLYLLPGSSNFLRYQRRGARLNWGIVAPKANLLGFFAIWVSLQLVEINDNLVTTSSTNGFSIATTRYIVWSDFRDYIRIFPGMISSTFFHTSNREVYFYCLFWEAVLVLSHSFGPSSKGPPGCQAAPSPSHFPTH